MLHSTYTKFFFRSLASAFLFTILIISCSGEKSQQVINQGKKSKAGQEINQLQQSEKVQNASTKKNELSDNSKSISNIQFEREGAFGSSDDIVIGQIATVSVDENDRVFIADRDQTSIHVFNPDENYLTSIGRNGEGPGEFGTVSDNTSIVVHSNRLYVTDTFRFFPHRVHAFHLNNLSFSHTMKLVAGNAKDFDKDYKGYYPKRIYPLNDGTFLVSYHRSPNEYQDKESLIRYVIQDSTATIISGTITELKDRTNLVYNVRNVPVPYTAIHSFPFFRKSLMAISHEDHIYTAWTDKFKIDIYNPEGKHLRAFHHPFKNKELNVNNLLSKYKESGYMAHLGDEVALNMLREAENLPDTWPALNKMFFDDKNRLWISTIVENEAIYEWWILESTGKLVTKFEWPRNEQIEEIRNGYMYTLKTENSTGFQTIIKYRIKLNE